MNIRTQEAVTFPLPIIITNEELVVIDFNEHAEHIKTSPIAKGVSFDRLFDTFEKSGNFYLGSYKDEKHLLIRLKMESKHFYLLFNGEHYFHLIEKVQELDKYNRELDAIIESSYDGFYITDNEGNTLKANSAIERITGIPKDYYIGKNINDLLRRGILKESVTLKVLEQKESVSLIQMNHNQKETLLTGSPIFNEEGEIEKIVTNIRDLTELNQLHKELCKVQKLNDKYKHELERLKAHKNDDPDIILKSDKMQELFQVAERLANVDTTILILGETGVGKDVFARHLYRVSDRYDKGKLIKVNCGAIPKDLLESELFGYESGAFSGASRNGKPGMFEIADSGFLFLDEVGELSLTLQVKLLRVLQEKEIQRIGGTRVKKVDVRIIAATNKDLKKMVKKGTFREDLYYRLNVVPVSIPPLRERRDDILPLIQYFLNEYTEKYDIQKSFDKELKEFFYDYDWPGNVRELSNLVERLLLTIPTKIITISDLPEEYRTDFLSEYELEKTKIVPLNEAVEHTEKKLLREALKRWKSTYKIAKHLQTSQATIVRKLQKYNLKK
ncbi:sigma-54 interaction domain-containing protein [Evansella halocellulosilytica]|uniref:sigma-54 interaction domain-containing protein n=1 Tax=Evansella halocellulosilytica TaxID=2011013 RepID=UPI000BB7DCD6|nr:sigma 54-interacting transcriptional regulator [Evansella halocellulosilytica]